MRIAMYRKLTAAEISRVMAKIRRKYDEYCKKFFKPKKVKSDFEDRYVSALRGGLDVSNFLLAEISAIEELIRTEEKKIEDARPPRPNGEAKESFADKIIKENMAKIDKYHTVPFNKDANIEVKKLLGALDQLYQKDFPMIFNLLRSQLSPSDDRLLTSLETQLRFLGFVSTGMVSGKLSRYYSLLNRFPRDYRAIEWEEKQFLLESAFLLHDLYGLLAKIKENTAFKSEANETEFDRIIQFIYGVIEDFRLKDFKRT